MTIRSMASNKLSSKIFNAKGVVNPAIAIALTTRTVIVKFASTSAWTIPSGVGSVDYLVVAGGGGGGGGGDGPPQVIMVAELVPLAS